MVDLTSENEVEKSVHSGPSIRRAVFQVVDALLLYRKSACGVMRSVFLRCEVWNVLKSEMGVLYFSIP